MRSLRCCGYTYQDRHLRLHPKCLSQLRYTKRSYNYPEGDYGV